MGSAPSYGLKRLILCVRTEVLRLALQDQGLCVEIGPFDSSDCDPFEEFVHPRTVNRPIPPSLMRDSFPELIDHINHDELPPMEIQYELTNGWIFRSDEIHYAKVSDKIAPELLPRALTEERDELYLPLSKPNYRDSLMSTIATLRAILLHVVHRKVELVLTTEFSRTVPRRALEIKRLKFLPIDQSFPLNIVCENATEHTGDVKLIASVKGVPDKALLVSNFYLHDDELVFHTLSKSVAVFCQNSESNTIDLPPGWNVHNIEAQGAIETRLAELKHELSTLGPCELDLPKTRVVGEDDYSIDVQLKKYIFRYCLVIKGEFEKRFWGLPRISVALFEALRGGLRESGLIDERLLRAQSKSFRRTTDLKLIRHCGVYASYLLEVCTYILDKRMSTGEAVCSIDEFYDRLYDRLGSLFQQSPGSLRVSCSKLILSAFEEHTEQLIVLSEQPVSYFESGEIVSVEGAYRSFFRLIRFWLEQKALVSGGLLFQRQKSNFFPSFKETTEEGWAPLEPPKPVSPLPRNLWFMLAHLPSFKVTFDNKTIESVTDDSFSMELDIDEKDEDIEWFELSPKFFLNGNEIGSEIADLLLTSGVVEYNGTFFQVASDNLPTFEKLKYFWNQVIGPEQNKNKTQKKKNSFFVPRARALQILALRAAGVPIKGGTLWTEVCEFYDSLGSKREFVVPKGIHATLKPYQKLGAQWVDELYHLRLGGILADDMGLGKTLQALTFLVRLHAAKKLRKNLIVVPTSLTYNWKCEAEKFAPGLPLEVFRPKDKEDLEKRLETPEDIVLVLTYGLLVEHGELFMKSTFNTVFFDEAQSLKNLGAKRTSIARKIKARFKCCLTGTPMENHLGELYSLLDLVLPGSLGNSKEFKMRYVNQDHKVNSVEAEHLKSMIRPVVLRRTKSKILKELPKRTESRIKLPFEKRQLEIYRDLAVSWNKKVTSQIHTEGVGRSQLMMLTALLRLRQVCSDPGGVPNIKYEGKPPKVSLLMDSLDEITDTGESALVFTQFLHTFDRIEKELKKRGICHFRMNGKMGHRARQNELEGFDKCEKGAVFLMTLKTGGFGLNLTKATYVFHVEPWWNPAVENQATDRTHRIGQTKPVWVYRYIMEDSVEE